MKNALKSTGWLLMDYGLTAVVGFGVLAGASFGEALDLSFLLTDIMNISLVTIFIANILFCIYALLVNESEECSVKKEWKLLGGNKRALVLFCVSTAAYSMAYQLSTYGDLEEIQLEIQSMAEYSGAWTIPAMIVLLMLLVPLKEEMLCRWILLNTLRRSFSERTAICVSAGMYGMYTFLRGYGYEYAIETFLLGMFLAFIYQETQLLYIAVAVHITANVPKLVLLFPIQINETANLILQVVCYLCFLVCLGSALRIVRKQKADTVIEKQETLV